MPSRNSSQKKPDGWGAARGGQLSGHARRLAAPRVYPGSTPALDLSLPGPSRARPSLGRTGAEPGTAASALRVSANLGAAPKAPPARQQKARASTLATRQAPGAQGATQTASDAPDWFAGSSGASGPGLELRFRPRCLSDGHATEGIDRDG